VEQQQKGSLLNIASNPLTVFGGGIPGTVIQQAAAIGVPISFLAFSRRDEEEADFLGLQYLYKAGYDPMAMVSFFEKVSAREAAGAKISTLFSTHPQTEERKKLAQQEIATYFPDRTVPAVASADFQSVKARLMTRN
jgi:beta-barrel assembly-enhancing protease